MLFRRRQLEIVLFTAVAAWTSGAAAYPDVSDGLLAHQAADIARLRWVTAQGNDLVVDGQPLRVWGYNVQAGPFKTYPELDRLVDRLAFSGVNAVRLWPTSGTFFSQGKFASSERGDGSTLDRYDYLFAKLAQRGIYVHATALHAIDEAYVASSDDEEVRAVFAGAKGGRFRELHGIAPYLSQSYRALLKAHIQFVLDHTNPYTGRKYSAEPAVSTWELANETSFVHCLLDAKCVSRLPERLAKPLEEQWGRVSGKGDVSVLDALAGQGEVYERYKAFVISRFKEASAELRSFAQSRAKSGSGVAVQPFSFASQAGAPLLAARYAASGGEVAEVSAYQNTLTADAKSLGYPFQPLTVRGPLFYNFNLGGVDGKPTIVYETSFFRPNPYRAEWGGAMATFAKVQGWSGAFLYFFGQPNIIYSAEGKPEGYGAKPLPEPRSMDESKGFNVYYGLHHGGDEVAVASWLIGALAFRGLSDTGVRVEQIAASERSVVRPGAGVRAVAKCAGPIDAGTLENLSTERRMRWSFQQSSSATDASCPDCGCAKVSSAIQPVPGVEWNRSAGTLRWSQPGLKGVIGFARGKFDLADGFSLTLQAPEFAAVVAARSATDPNRYYIVVAGQSENTGFSFQADAVDRRSPFGAIAGVRAAGDAPVVQHRVTGVLDLPEGEWTVQKFDFQGRALGEATSRAVKFQADEPLFFAVVTKKR